MMSFGRENDPVRRTIGLGTKFLILVSAFLAMFVVLSFISEGISAFEMEERTRMLVVSALQGILVFMVPSICVAYVESRHPFKLLSLNRYPSLRNLAGLLLMMVVGMPMLNQIIYYNQQMHLPQFLSGVETVMRQWEDASQSATELILNTTSVSGLVWGVVVVGVITGWAEEMFFRGGIQRLLMEALNPHVAIWTAAFIFSAIHLQFFGFIPRLLLGAFFGYLYWWTGCLRLAAFGHILNNSLVVISMWFINRGLLSSEMDSLGVSESGFPVVAAISTIGVVAILVYARKLFKK